MRIGDRRRIFINSSCQVEATVKMVRPYGQGRERCLLVTYDVPGYGETQPFMMPCGSESPYADDPSRRISMSMMPEGYMQKTGKDFDWSLYGEDTEPQKKIVNAFVTRYAEFERSGRGLYIFSKVKGSGKTFLACILANEIAARRPFSLKFITLPDLIELVKSRDELDRQTLDGLYACRLLIMDDIGAHDGGQAWINEAIFRLIDYRYRERRPVIFTSNCDTSHLDCDERIADRIEAMTVPLRMPEVRVRKQIAARESGEFLRSVMG